MADLVTIEFYAGSTTDTLLAAADVFDTFAQSNAMEIGKLLCRLRGLDSLTAQILNRDGGKVETMIVYKKG